MDPLVAVASNPLKDFDEQIQNPEGNVSKNERYSKFLVDSDECTCINPESSHVCSYQLVRDDSFGILNPVFKDEDLRPSPAENNDVKVPPTNRLMSKNPKNYKKSSNNSLSDRPVEKDLVAPQLRTNKNSYSDFLAAFCPLDSETINPYFSPNDFKKDMLLPLPVNIQNNVLQNTNAKKESFRTSKPKKKARENLVSAIKSSSSDNETESKTISTCPVNKEKSLNLKPTSTPMLTPRICVTPCFQSEAMGSGNHHIHGDNYDRGEYLKYKKCAEISSTKFNQSQNADSNFKSFLMCPAENIPISKRRYSCYVPQDNKSSTNIKKPQIRRKTSLPSEASFEKHLDISSVFENDLTASMKYIYQPLPREIFDNSYTKENTSSTYENDIISPLNFPLQDYGKINPTLKSSFTLQQKTSKYNPITPQLHLQANDSQILGENSNGMENNIPALSSCQHKLLRHNRKSLDETVLNIKFDERKSEDSNFDELSIRKSISDVGSVVGKNSLERKKSQDENKQTKTAGRKQQMRFSEGFDKEELLSDRKHCTSSADDHVLSMTSFSGHSNLLVPFRANSTSSFSLSPPSSRSLPSSPDTYRSFSSPKQCLLSLTYSAWSSTSSSYSSSSSFSSSTSSSSVSSSNSSTTDSSDLDDILF